MADCSDTLKELNSFLDGELSPEAHDYIRTHIGDCVDCLQAFDFEAELKQAIRRKCRNDEMPPGLLGRIEQCLDEDLDGDGIIGPPT